MTTPHLEHVAPALLTTEHNVRKDLHLDKDFLKSVKQNGVLEPIVAFPDPLLEGHYRVHLGHRRAVAAVEAGLLTVPVYVISEREAADRVTEQLVENQHRAALRPAEIAGAFEQLTLFGMSAMQIARRTSTPLAKVGDAITVAKNPIASKILTEHQLTIEDALVFDEFAGDDDALAELDNVVQTRPEQLAHAAQRIRGDRAEKAEQARLEQDIRERGIRLIELDKYGQAVGHVDVESLRVGAEYYATGAKNLTLKRALAEAGDDLGAYPAWGWGKDDAGRSIKVWQIRYAVRNHQAHGWCHYNDRAPKGPLSDDEKADRRLARENGKLFHAATEVRLAWLKKFLERRTLPADWHLIPALAWAERTDHHYSARTRTAELLGATKPDYQKNTLYDLVTSNPAQAPHFLLALAITDFEGRWDKQGWKTHTPAHPHYLRLLSTWGYTLADIEEHVVNTALAGDEGAA